MGTEIYIEHSLCWTNFSIKKFHRKNEAPPPPFEIHAHMSFINHNMSLKHKAIWFFFFFYKIFKILTVLRFFQDHSVPLTWLCSFSVMIASVSAQSKCVRYTRVSLIFLYKLIESVSFINSRTTSPCSFSTTNTSSGFAIREIITRRNCINKTVNRFNCVPAC